MHGKQIGEGGFFVSSYSEGSYRKKLEALDLLKMVNDE